MKQLSLKVVTPEDVVYEDVADSISVMTEAGEVTVLPNHIPLVSNLQPGEARIKKDGATHYLAVSGGFLQVHSGTEVVILADSADRAEDLELEKIEQAKKRAKELLEQKRDEDDVAFARAQAQLEKELNRYKVAKRRGKRSRRRGSSVPRQP